MMIFTQMLFTAWELFLATITTAKEEKILGN